MTLISIWLTSTDVVCWNFRDDLKEKIENTLNDTRVLVCPDAESFKQSLSEADMVIVWRFKQEWLELAPKLKFIITPAAGRELIVLNLPPDISIVHFNFHGKIIGETVLGMMLSHSRGICSAGRLMLSEAWPRAVLDRQMRLLRGSTLTILGFGNIGSWIGRLAKPFGMKIYGVKRSVGSAPDYFDNGDQILSLAEMDAVLHKTDYLVLSLPSSDETTNLVDGRRLGLLPAHASVYNVGRGNSINEPALIEALESETIAAAYLDVFNNEPLPMESSLRSCRNCHLMPHASAFAPEFMDYFVEDFLSRYAEL